MPPVTVIAGLLNATPTVPELVAGQLSEGPLVMVKGQVLAAATPLASFTWTVKLPLAVGVPLMAPVVVFSVRPAGRVPLDTEKVYGETPPVTVMAGLLKAAPTSPEVVAGQLSEGPPEMVNEHVLAAATPLASFTWILKLPAAVGVPLMAPVEVFRVRPAGRVPLDTEKV